MTEQSDSPGFFELFLTEEGFATNRSNPYTVLEPKDVLREMDWLKSLSMKSGRTLPVLLDISGLIKMNKASRGMMSNFRYKDFVSAGALVASNDIAHLIGNFVLQSISTPVPLKIFREREKARLWLLEQMKGEER